MEDGWRMHGGMKPMRHKATGGNGGCFSSYGKNIQEFPKTCFEFVLSTERFFGHGCDVQNHYNY